MTGKERTKGVGNKLRSRTRWGYYTGGYYGKDDVKGKLVLSENKDRLERRRRSLGRSGSVIKG